MGKDNASEGNDHANDGEICTEPERAKIANDTCQAEPRWQEPHDDNRED